MDRNIETDTATYPGSVHLRLYKSNGERTDEVATFYFRSGTTVEFLTESLKTHGRNLFLSSHSKSLGVESDQLLDPFKIKLVVS